MDRDENDDLELTINTTKFNLSKYENSIQNTYVGSEIQQFDSCIVLSHFKGHGSAGFGGAVKQLSIGFASRAGKAYKPNRLHYFNGNCCFGCCELF